MMQIRKCMTLFFAVFIVLLSQPVVSSAEELPYYLQDRGKGVTTSLFGTYIQKGQLLVYPFYEYVKVSNEEYHGSELGFTGKKDYMGSLVEHEYLLFLAYGFTENLAIELEGAFYTEKTLEKADNDTTSGIPNQIKESGLGDIEAQVRWRLLKEKEGRPELYCNFEVAFPFQKDKVLIGVQDWEYSVGIGVVKGFTWGTLTPRISFGYEAAEDEIKFGEYAAEYLKRLNDSWRWVTTLEGEDDELSMILEAQLHINSNAFWKFNSGFGLSEKAPDFAPEIGIMFVF